MVALVAAAEELNDLAMAVGDFNLHLRLPSLDGFYDWVQHRRRDDNRVGAD